MTNFIGEYFLEDLDLCDRLIHFFNHSLYAKNNRFRGCFNGEVDEKRKMSTEIALDYWTVTYPVIAEYSEAIKNIADQYAERYPFCKDGLDNWDINETPKIQHYAPNEGYFIPHCERDTGYPPIGRRHLVFMTYLNTVTDAGGTEFVHQDIIINAERGKTLIWPADWTHTHRGISSPTQDKYIITGWFNFLVND